MTFAPALLVPGPARTALPFGLFSVLTFGSPTDPHWQGGGVDWEPVAGCLDVLGSSDPGCFDPDTDAPWVDAPDPVGLPVTYTSTDTGGLQEPAALPFQVYGRYKCSPVGRSLDYAEQRATASLVAGEEYRVEQAVWTGDLANIGFAPGAGELATGVSPRVGLGLLEDWIADNYRSQGVIHVTRAGATALAGAGLLASSTSGGVLRTMLGTPVVAGSGYPGSDPAGNPAADGTTWAYVTPALLSYRSEPFPSSATPGGSFDRANNDLYALVGRTYVIGWDMCAGVPSTSGVNFTLNDTPEA